ncbi:MAG: hypothetical protein RIQ94_3463 [Pseudomonadota bacterium]|jgi:uncharacterized protein (DUF1778 family)
MNKKEKNKQRVEAGKPYKVTFGVNQTENINKAANTVNETPQQFLINATIESAENLTQVQ